MKLFWKKKQLPVTNDTKEVEVVQLWYVRWNSVKHSVATHWKAEVNMEAFTSEEAAMDFKESLMKATAILKDDYRTIRIEKN